MKNYPALPTAKLAAGVSFHRPPKPEARHVNHEAPAVEVMTDFKKVRALTTMPTATMDFAKGRMQSNKIHLLLVIDINDAVVGLVTSTDIEGEKPIRIIQERGIRRDEVHVEDIMTPTDRLEVLDMADVQRASVGQVVATLQASGRQHALVAERDGQGMQSIRGLFSSSQLSRQVGSQLSSVEVARNFAEVGEVLLRRQ